MSPLTQGLSYRAACDHSVARLKFDTDDYVGDMTPHAKMVKIGPAGPTRQRGEM